MGSNPDPRLIQTADGFAESLRVLRERTGLSLRAIALQLLKKNRAEAPTYTTLGGWFSGSHLPTPRLAAILPELLGLLGVVDSDEITEWQAAFQRVRSRPGPRPAGAPVPYRGLAAYEPEHARYFYGRNTLTNELLALARGRHVDGGLMVVVGASGSGKSSLLGAGLIAALDREDMPLLPGRWCYLLFTPRADPLHELARNIADLAGSSAETVEAKLAADPSSAGDLIRRTASSSTETAVTDTQMLIVVDQFEELFTSGAPESEKAAFVQALCSAARREPGTVESPPALVVLGLRADFYAQALGVPELVPALQDAQLVVGSMTSTELRQAIIEPAHQESVEVEDGLVELIVRELAPAARIGAGSAHEVGVLPFLSHALLATWEYEKANVLTVDRYLATGGIQGAIAQTAEQAFAALSAPQRETARQLFLRLIRVGDDVADTRRKVERYGLIDRRSDPGSDNVEQVLNQFISARLITVSDETVEITHESLLTAWPRLATWLNTDRSWLDMHHRLAIAAAEWASSDRDPDRLYRGGNLQIAQDQISQADRSRELNVLEREFLEASQARETAELRAARRRVRRRYQLTAIVAAVIVAAASFVTYVRESALNTERLSAQVLLSRLVASEADRVLDQDVPEGMQLALIAYRISPTPQARSSLLDATDVAGASQVPGVGGPVNEIAVSRGGRLLAQGTDPGTVQLWDIARNGRISRIGPDLRNPSGSVDSMAFGPGGKLLATAGDGSHGLYLWNTSVAAHPVGLGALPGAGSAVSSVAISPNGRLLAAGLSDNNVAVWSLANPTRPTLVAVLRGSTQQVNSVTFSPNGHVVAAGSPDFHVYLWNIARIRHTFLLSRLSGPSSVIFTIAISPNGRYLAAGTGAQHDVYLWNISNPAHAVPDGPPLTGPDSYVNSVAFSPDGTTLAAASSDSQLWLYNFATRTLIGQFPHPSPVTDVVFRSNQSLATVATNGTNGIIRIWQLPGPVLTDFRDSVFSVSFDAAGNRLGIAPGAQDNTASVWNATNIQHPMLLGRRLADIASDAAFSGSGAISPDGDTFAVGCVDGRVQLWNIANPAHPRLYGAPIPAATQLVESVAISGDGRMMAVGANDSVVHLWDIRNPSHPVRLAQLRPRGDGAILDAVFSPDSHLVAAASTDNDVYLWNVSDPRRPRLESTLTGFTGAAYSVVFTNNGRILAASSDDATVRLWGIARPAHPVHLATLTGPVSNVYSIAYDPHNSVLAAGSTDGTIWLWNLNNPRNPYYLATLIGPARGVLSVTFSPNGRTLVAGGQDQTVHLWDTSPRSAASWICSTVDRPISRRQWRQFVPTAPYSPPCR